MITRALAFLAVVALTASPALAATGRAATGPGGAPVVKAAPAAAKAVGAPVEVSGAWIREAPPGSHALGGYMTIANHGKQAVTLEGITSPLFESIEMHNVVEEDGRMRMQQADRFEIPAGGTLVFKPRDRHFMLMGPKKEFHSGDKVPLTLSFGKAGTCTVTVEVKRPS
jgi:copper(I)-binding protein